MEQTVVFESTPFFSVPTSVVDQHLKAPDVELRLILFLMRHVNSSFTKHDICTALSENEERIDKAFKFWCAAGVLFKSGNKYIAERPSLQASEIAPYSPEEIATRIDSDPQLKFLYTCAEEALAKPLTTSDVTVIFSLVDWNGLPAEVAAMLIRYGVSCGKGLARIQKLGIEWAQKDITTYEKAEEYIRSEQMRKDVVSSTASLLGLTHRALTEAEKKLFCEWRTVLDFGTDMIKLAYERAVASTGKYSYPYIDKILRSWFESGYHTPEEVAANDTPDKKSTTRRPAKKKYDSKIDKKDLQSSVDDSWAIIEAELDKDSGKGKNT